MPKVADMELIKTNKGVMAIHMHAGDDPRFCFGWLRVDSGNWRQRHLKAYGSQCNVCRHLLPNTADLDALYDDHIKDGIGKLKFVEL
jgi:hypothetical protein